MFDRDAFARAIRVRVAERGITMQDAAAEIAVSHSTLCRVANLGKSPDVENYLRINAWLASAEPSDGIAAARPLGIGQREEGGCRDA